MVIDEALLSRSLAERNDTYIVSPNSVNEGENDAIRLGKSDVEPSCLFMTGLWKRDLVEVFVDEVGVVEVKSVLSQVCFSLGIVPFVHGKILGHSWLRLDRSQITADYLGELPQSHI
jgi:hypothetical protein